ncbi:MAG: sodium-dependent transporter [Sedimentisphaerales bacterium]|nr:sodium-dependent transporter [Sedimentisphaerales bacterium]
MAELLEEQRESWGTRGGFILAAIGSAVGLGNLWGFPYKLYSYGGGAFLIPYILALIVVGFPLLILEFSLGHYTQRAAPDAFKQSHKKFEIVGWWGIILAFVIITYYPVILAYCFSFLWYSIQGIANNGQLPWAGQGVEGVKNAKEFFFDNYLGYQEGTALGPIRWNIVLPLIIAWLTMYLCIFRGVKLVGKVVWLTVPLPWLMLLILTIRGLTLEGSMQGLAYYLDPVWSELAKPATWRYAFGQVFFSLSLAFGVMITYASFLHRKSDINNNALIISISDFGTSFVAGLAVFATLGGMAFVTQQAGHPVEVENVAESGPSLAFVAFPYALAQLPYSAWFSLVFFFTLITLGIDSAFSITESVLASIVDKTGWKRSIVLPVMSLIGLAFGLIYITQGGLNWLGIIDGFVNGTRGIMFLGLMEALVLGWLWRLSILRRHANSRSDWKLGKWWDYIIRLVIPIILGTLFFWQLFEDINNKDGFLRTPEGKWIASNCVGVGILVIAPLISIVLSSRKGRNNNKVPTAEEVKLQVRGRLVGAIAFITAIASGVVFIISMQPAQSSNVKTAAFWILAAGGVIATALSFYILEKFDSVSCRTSWLARWAGIFGTMDIAALFAKFLYEKSAAFSIEKNTEAVTHELTGVSYAILVIVFLIIIGGLGWCFYKALSAAGANAAEQHPEEVGDEPKAQSDSVTNAG